MNIIEKFKNDIVISRIDNLTKSSTYEVVIECDANDGDYITDSFTMKKDDYENDILLQLVIAYVSSSGKKFRENIWEASYGNHIWENKDLPWLKNYVSDKNLLIYCGAIDDRCHSIVDIEVSYFDENGIEYNVELPDLDTYFDTKKEMIDYLNNLYENRA